MFVFATVVCLLLLLLLLCGCTLLTFVVKLIIIKSV